MESYTDPKTYVFAPKTASFPPLDTFVRDGTVIASSYGRRPGGNRSEPGSPRVESGKTATLRPQEGAIRKFTVNLLSAAALVAAGYALLRQGSNRPEPDEARLDDVPAGERIPGRIRLEKLRELGI